MGADRLNWINQGITECAKVLRTAVELMHPDKLDGGKGKVVSVHEHALDEELMEQNAVVYCSVTWQGNSPTDIQAASQTDHWLEVDIVLEAKAPKGGTNAERQALWRTVARAQSVLNWLLLRETAFDGGKFNGCIPYVELGATKALERFAEDGSYVAVAETSVKLHVTLQDYENPA